ncbi:RND family efflux transporter, MFP subunit [Mesorhizobium albiziae]|uniref:RND family efflux transporter, MFP subunit n=1 Tax=Neomesorhizobium albiziae TaxID=335020 RepID=A0A1I3ZBT9_9HYPH|nr:efflux RND transporter periplasmic adaptor subunit [Mesorhizobium albiziae]GLS32143.1 acriflavin resistance protein [Mesorhizobium albiziae]SFK41648.1 RND family efflux transporter, MFP subunit [Mesorhizobium albiziae]
MGAEAVSFKQLPLLVPLILVSVLLAGCQRQEAEAPKPPILVRAVDVAFTDYSPTLSLTGVIAARTLNSLAFRVGGRVSERLVDVGQRVEKDTVLARLDPEAQQSDLRSAQADVAAAEAQLRQTTAAFDRQKTLLAQGFTTRRDYDLAEQAMRTSQASVDSANSELSTARENLSFTELRAGRAGIVTDRSVETGQVVQAAQTVFTIAEDGDRDAVFNVDEKLVDSGSAAPPVTIMLIADPTVTATGKVREVSPVVDQASGSVRVKVEVPNTPPAMPLGAPITGTVSAAPRKAVVLPWEALTSADGKPSVWIVDKNSKAVSPRLIDILSYDTGIVVVKSGLDAGQSVVTAGVQFLSPGQTVEIVAGEGQ